MSINLQSPCIKTIINQQPAEILIDTGCQTSCISENFYRKLIGLGKEVRTIPVSGVIMLSALGNRTKDVNKQVFLDVQLNSETTQIIFLVVNNLINEVIIGNDWLHAVKGKVDFNKKTLEIELNKKILLIPFVNDKINPTEDTSNLNTVETHLAKNDELENKADYPAQPTKLQNLLHKYKDICSDKPGLTNKYTHDINIKNETSFQPRNYPIPIAYRQKVQEKVEEMLQDDIIERTDTPYINPVVPVIKKDNTVRICLDARNLNKCIEMDYECPPAPDQILYRHNNCIYMSTIDLTASFWQIPINRRHRKYTGFMIAGRVYNFKVVPFGLKTAVAALTRCLDMIFGKNADFIAPYVDDLLITSNSEEEHYDHLEYVLSKLSEANMTINIKKCNFFRQEVKFLGHILSTKGIRIDNEKVTAIMKFPVPKNIKHLRAFLGFCNYSRKFCEKYADILHPLYILLKKGTKWHWEKQQQSSFDKIKLALANATMLHHPDISKSFWVQTDASGIGIAGRLFQITDDGEEQNIAFASRKLTNSEMNFSTSEREMLSIVYCLKKWETVILGFEVFVLNDHKALSFLLNCKLTNSRIARWILSIQHYNLIIHHCKGSENILADTLSRYPPEVTKNPNILEIATARIKLDKTLTTKLKDIENLQRQDKTLRKMFILCEQTETLKYKFLEYKIIENKIYARKNNTENWKIFIPKELIEKVVLEIHEKFGHYGTWKCHSLISEICVWNNMKRNISKIIAKCQLCQQTKISGKYYKGPMKPILPVDKEDLIAVDIFGPLPPSTGGVRYILVILNVFTKFVKLYPIKKCTSTTIINKFVRDYFPSIVKPKRILSDNATYFTGRKWKAFLNEHSIQELHSSVRYPQGNPSERVMKELGRLLRVYCHMKHTSWASHTKKVELLINCAVHESTGIAPIFIQTGKHPIEELETIFNLPKETKKDIRLELIKKNLPIKENYVRKHTIKKRTP